MKTRNIPTLLAAIVGGFDRTRSFSIVRIATAATLISAAAMMAVILGTEALVTVGSPPSPLPQNVQVEPALAVDAAHPNVLAAGAIDGIDLEAKLFRRLPQELRLTLFPHGKTATVQGSLTQP